MSAKFWCKKCSCYRPTIRCEPCYTTTKASSDLIVSRIRMLIRNGAISHDADSMIAANYCDSCQKKIQDSSGYIDCCRRCHRCSRTQYPRSISRTMTRYIICQCGKKTLRVNDRLMCPTCMNCGRDSLRHRYDYLNMIMLIKARDHPIFGNQLLLMTIISKLGYGYCKNRLCCRIGRLNKEGLCCNCVATFCTECDCWLRPGEVSVCDNCAEDLSYYIDVREDRRREMLADGDQY
jgi:hypothetical protein